MLIGNSPDEWSGVIGEYFGGDTDEVKTVVEIVEWTFRPVD